MSAPKWEIIIKPESRDGAIPGVRRLAVPGGWLYQVEGFEILQNGRAVQRCWQSPVFVPDPDAEINAACFVNGSIVDAINRHAENTR